MARVWRMLTVVLVAGWSACAAAEEKPISELPKDLWKLAFVWTEPIKGVVRETQRFDPISGLWLGMLEGSVKSVQRTTDFFLPESNKQNRHDWDGGKRVIRYTF